MSRTIRLLLRNWLGRWKVDARLRGAGSRLDDVGKWLVEAAGELDDFNGKLEKIITSNQRLLSKSEEALDTCRSQLRVAEETVKSLVAANKVLMDRWDAESAIQQRRRVSAIVEEGRE